MRRYLALLLVSASVACDGIREPVGPPAGADSPGLIGKLADQIQGKRFVVVLEDRADPRGVARDHGLSPDVVFEHVFHGFTGSMSDAAREGLLRDARVLRVAAEKPFFTSGVSTPAASWGLDRIDQRGSTLDGVYTYGATGKGVTVYIVDTGIRYSHGDFGGRALFGFDSFGADGSDCLGHGTHVAGIVGGTVYGVAKQVNLVSVRVLNCAGNGNTSTVAAGLDWVFANARRPAIVNMSLTGDPDDVVDDAVRRLVGAGIPVVVAAGNDNADACAYSPGRVSEAMTVGATTIYDNRASFSNFGDCIDWYAPGLGITSDWFDGDAATAIESGTSMAAPHTAGAAALYLEQNASASSADVTAMLASWTTTHAIDTREKGGGKAPLLYTLPGAATGNVAPTANFAFHCVDLACSFTDASSDVDGSVVEWTWNFGDGNSASGQNASHTFPSTGQYQVTLTVKDDAGATGTSSQYVAVGLWTPTNTPPTANFAATCTRLSCSFADGSTDSDGAVVRWAWDFGDGASTLALASTGQTHTFLGGGSYVVTLTVTDDDGASAEFSSPVDVGLILTATGYRQKGHQLIDLAWKGATTLLVEIYLDSTKIAVADATAPSFTYETGKRGQGAVAVKVCDFGTSYCSADVMVNF